MRLQNLKLLLRSMRSHYIILQPFLFIYNQIEYVVIVEDVRQKNKNESFWPMEITFIKTASQDSITKPANGNSIDIGRRELKRFFRIKNHPNETDVFIHFYSKLNSMIPTRVREVKNEEKKYI